MLAKIRSALLRAGQASGEFGEAEADLLTAQVAKVLIHSFRNAPPGHRAHPGRGRAEPDRRQSLSRPRAPTSSTAKATRSCARTARRVVDVGSLDQRIPVAPGLARQRQRQPGLFAGRPDPQCVRQGGGQLLAQPCLSARTRRSAPRGRDPRPRPRHAGGLLRRLVAAHPAARRPQRRAGQGRGGAAQAHVHRGRPDRQLPRHAAERMGRRAGVLLVRHLHGALHPQRQAEL